MLKIEFAPQARTQLRIIIQWWKLNRSAAPRQVTNELRRALQLLTDYPQIGRRYEHPSGRQLRWYGLRRTPYFLVYEVRAAQTLGIVAVGSSMRGRRPDLG